MELKLLDLFSGTGGFALGLKKAGFNIVQHQFSEIDQHAIANYKYNFKNAEYVGSVTDVQGTRNQANIITFGSPCQDFSLAGKRQGMQGQRSSLIMEAIRLITEIQPSIFIWENVKGTFSSNNGADFWAILNAFTNIGRYRLEWQLLNTSWFLPQNRERIYLIGHLAGQSKPGIFPFRENDKLFNKKNQPKQRQSQTENSTSLKASGAIKADDTFIKTPKKASCLSGGGNSGGLHSDMTIIPVLTLNRKEKRQNGRRFKDNSEPSFTLNCQDQHGVMIKSNTKQGFEVANQGDSINFSVPNSKTRRGRVGKNQSQTLDTACNQGVIDNNIEVIGGTQKNAGKMTNKSTALTEAMGKGGGHIPMVKQLNKSTESNGQPYQQNRVYSDKGILPALNSELGGRNNVCLSHYGHKNKSAKKSKIVPTLKAQSHGHEPMTTDKAQIRRLTEIECERLQGFPDNWTKHGIYNGKVKTISKTQRYKLLGNAVTVAVVEAIGKRLKEQLTF